MILSWIYSSLSPKIMTLIMGHTTSHFALSALEKNFYASSKAHIMQQWFQFQTLKKVYFSIMEYIMKSKSIVDILIVIVELVIECDNVLRLLRGLGLEYNSWFASITTWYSVISLGSIHMCEPRIVMHAFPRKWRDLLFI